MAFYIKITKVETNENTVRYRFEAENGREGLFDFKSSDGAVELVKAMEGDGNEHCFKRAAAKIYKEWKNGNLPDEAEWAS